MIPLNSSSVSIEDLANELGVPFRNFSLVSPEAYTMSGKNPGTPLQFPDDFRGKTYNKLHKLRIAMVKEHDHNTQIFELNATTLGFQSFKLFGAVEGGDNLIAVSVEGSKITITVYGKYDAFIKKHLYPEVLVVGIFGSILAKDVAVKKFYNESVIKFGSGQNEYTT